MTVQTLTSDFFEFEALLNAFPKEFIEITPREQTLAISLYRLLSLGEPVTHAQLAETSTVPSTESDRLLEKWNGVYYDDSKKIVGFLGLTLNETPHKMLIDGRKLYAWCAWDTLFLPALVGKTTQVISRCAQSGKRIQLTISPERIELFEPAATVLSFVTPDENGIREDVINNFCHAVLFFQSPEAGEQWIAEHPNTFLLSVQKAFALAQLFNQQKYPGLLTDTKLENQL